MAKAAASPQIDAAIGHTLRDRRRAAGLTLAQVGTAAGISYQQVQKYETGTDRLPVARLVQIARAIQADPADMLRAAVQASQAGVPVPPTPRAVVEITQGAATLQAEAQRHLAMFLRTLRPSDGPRRVAGRWAGK